MCQLCGADLGLRPSWRTATIQDPRKTWLAAGSRLTVWWKMLSLGLRLQHPLAFQLWLLQACLSASGQRGAGLQPASSPLVFVQPRSTLCSVSRPGCVLSCYIRAFYRKVLFPAVAAGRVFCVCVCVCVLIQIMLPSEIPKLPADPSVREFPTVWKLLLHDSLPRTGLHPYLFCLSFCLLYFVLPPFENNGLPFWVPGVLCQCSEVVLWKLLSIQTIF